MESRTKPRHLLQVNGINNKDYEIETNSMNWMHYFVVGVDLKYKNKFCEHFALFFNELPRE